MFYHVGQSHELRAEVLALLNLNHSGHKYIINALIDQPEDVTAVYLDRNADLWNRDFDASVNRLLVGLLRCNYLYSQFFKEMDPVNIRVLQLFLSSTYLFPTDPYRQGVAFDQYQI
ncbi:hypothetical protein [Mesotoga sp. UBA5557]|jgi:hypothetical protein|uniref:hypothetical protein n=1 Tax=Mesotoga sp. UBA5557 TaxID=1946857 RepID=UPI0025DC6546|nr:hypothetical protein [Mesotoga sp. UBA5557]